jgi:hypothetical protein
MAEGPDVRASGLLFGPPGGPGHKAAYGPPFCLFKVGNVFIGNQYDVVRFNDAAFAFLGCDF